jgi:hypothetical protein
LRGRPSWDQFDDLTTMAMRDAGAMLWQRKDLRPRDVDVAELYDGFSFLAMAWLEGLGFCGRGESGPFVADGTRIALDGEIPLNTHGGQLSAGRLHGYGFLHEACVQLWGDGGARQVAGDPRVAVAAAGRSAAVTPGGVEKMRSGASRRWWWAARRAWRAPRRRCWCTRARASRCSICRPRRARRRRPRSAAARASTRAT